MNTNLDVADVVNTDRDQAHRVQWSGIIFYIGISFVFSWAIEIGLRSVLPFSARAQIAMFGPAISCLTVRLVRREGFADAGLRLAGKGIHGAWRYYLLAYFLPLLLLVLGGVIAFALGLQQWGLADYLKATPALAKLPVSILPVIIISSLTINVVVSMIFTFGEEFGWRGYLLPRLMPLGGIKAALLVGVVWGIWHAPLIVLDGYEYGGLLPWFGVVMFVVVTILYSILFTWLRTRTGSLWPTTLAHAMINQTAGVGAIFLTRGNPYLAAPIGLIGILPFLLFAGWIVFTGRLKPATEQEAVASNA